MVTLSMAAASFALFRTLAVSSAYRDRGATRAGQQLAQPDEQAIVRRRERDVAVRASDRLIRRAHAMRRSHRLRNAGA